MKKIAFVGIPMFLLLLVGCGQTSEKPGETVTTNETEIAETTQTSDSSKAESSMNTTTEESTTAETNASTSSVESETTNTSSVTETESSETTASNEETQTDAMTQLQMNFPTIAFPTNVPHTQGNVVNVASSGDENQLSVLY
jgi:cytoskeletal protein RodZ